MLLLCAAISAVMGGDGVDIDEDFTLFMVECVCATNGLLLSTKLGGPRYPGPIWLYELVITSGCLGRFEPGLGMAKLLLGELVKL